jgi:Zn-dependent peptidase ImmA (M78 family)
MNEAVRKARLKGAKAAQRTLVMLEAKERLAQWGGQIDVFESLATLDILVMFRPLDGLLGAYLRGTPPGVLISTKRQPSVQRFTAAHELGHAVMEHQPSIDTPDVLRRAALGNMGTDRERFSALLQEIEADAFAGDFLLPRWLLVHHASRKSWSGSDFQEPAIVYQLALRCGASFDATTRALERNGVVDSRTATALRQVKPKQLKATIKLQDDWADPWSDAWVLTSSDADEPIVASTGDLLGIKLTEHSAGGYRWHVDESTAFVNLSDETDPSEMVGGLGERTFVLRCEQPNAAPLEFIERRPWETQGETLQFHVRAQPREEGLARANRARLWAG